MPESSTQRDQDGPAKQDGPAQEGAVGLRDGREVGAMTASTESAKTPLMSRILASDALRRGEAAIIRRLAATEAERGAIMATIDLLALDVLEFDVRLTPHADDGWRLEAELRAKGAQRCGVTLDPAPFNLRERAVRIWSPTAAERDPEEEWEIEAMQASLANDAMFDEEVERLPDPVDLGVVAFETLCLSLDPYPRAPGAVFEGALAAPPGEAPLTDDAVRPFAGLAALVGAEAPADPTAAAPAGGDDDPKND